VEPVAKEPAKNNLAKLQPTLLTSGTGCQGPICISEIRNDKTIIGKIFLLIEKEY
jgi:hypothetical protein